jgi:uncharacterized protein YggT (Ycf19 family)
MSASQSFFTHWYFHVPNLVLAALMYTLLGRLLLSVVFRPDSNAVVWRVFKQVTDPALRIVAAVTPRMVPPLVLVALAVVWCLALRMALLVVLTMYGLSPKPGA